VRAFVLGIGILLWVTFLGGRTAALSEARRNPCPIIAEPATGLEIVAVGRLVTLVPAAAGPGRQRLGPALQGAPAPPAILGPSPGVGLPRRRGWLGVADLVGACQIVGGKSRPTACVVFQIRQIRPNVRSEQQAVFAASLQFLAVDKSVFRRTSAATECPLMRKPPRAGGSPLLLAIATIRSPDSKRSALGDISYRPFPHNPATES
jgi:hypothetical protein